MSVRAVAANGEVVVNTDTFVSSALTLPVQVNLPAINAGAGATVAVGTVIRFQSTGAAIEILAADGRRVGLVLPSTSAFIVAKVGAAQSAKDFWSFHEVLSTPAAFQAVTTPTAAEVIGLRTCLVNAGLMKAE